MKKNTNLLQIKVQLKNYKPSFYRTFILSEDDNFDNLHDYIQNTFWFYNYHLWRFSKDQLLEITNKDEYFEAYCNKTLEPQKTKLKDIFIDAGFNKMNYEYDYWDSWSFDVTCQKIIPNDWNMEFPKLIKMQWWMLIEDCWWVWGLEELVENYKKKEFDENFEDWEEFEEYMEHHFEKLEIEDFEL